MSSSLPLPNMPVINQPIVKLDYAGISEPADIYTLSINPTPSAIKLNSDKTFSIIANL